MSRSYKKGYSTITGHGDKEDRRLYHKCKRRKDYNILKECEKEFVGDCEDLISSEKIIENIDRDIGCADKYGWSSDGGAYFQEDLETLRKKFDKEVFGEECHRNRYFFRKLKSSNIWDKYLECKKIEKRRLSSYWLIDFVFKYFDIPMDFEESKELINWFRKNEEKIIRTYLKLNYNK